MHYAQLSALRCPSRRGTAEAFAYDARAVALSHQLLASGAMDGFTYPEVSEWKRLGEENWRRDCDKSVGEDCGRGIRQEFCVRLSSERACSCAVDWPRRSLTELRSSGRRQSGLPRHSCFRIFLEL